MELGLNDRATYCGYTIERKRDFPKRSAETIGYVVTDGTIINVMPGATWFQSLDDAHKAIAALELAKRIAAEPAGWGCDAQVFWHLLHLTGMRDETRPVADDRFETAIFALKAARGRAQCGDSGASIVTFINEQLTKLGITG